MMNLSLRTGKDCQKQLINLVDLGAICAHTYHIKTINNKGRNKMNTTLKLAIETYSELTGMSFDDIKNEMMNNECGEIYRRVVLLMLSAA